MALSDNDRGQFEFNYDFSPESVHSHASEKNGQLAPVDNGLWQKVKERLLSKHQSNKLIETWLMPAELHSCAQQDGRVIIKIAVPSPLHQYWLSQNFEEDLIQEIALWYKDPFSMEYVVTGQAQQPPVFHQPTSLSTVDVISERVDERDKLNPLYTFNSFVVGPNNEFAHAACFTVAENPGKSYNPLFIFGPTGMGKTHLLNAVGNHIRLKFGDLRICYLSAERYLNEYVSGIRRKTMDKFRTKYRDNCDVLLIDDIHTLARGEAIQDEFFHTFNHFFETGRQVVVASDQMPNDIKGLEERIRSRLQGGLVADIQMPDVETRMEILRYKADCKGIKLSDDVALFIANISKKSIRELEGNLNRVTIFAELRGLSVNLQTTKAVFANIQIENDSINADEIMKMVAETFNMKVMDLKSKTRTLPLVKARQAAMYLIRSHLERSVTDIGRLFNKDHSTVINALERLSYQRNKDPEFDCKIRALESRINNLMGR